MKNFNDIKIAVAGIGYVEIRYKMQSNFICLMHVFTQ